MEQENDKKIEEWFTQIGQEKFLVINALIDETVDKVEVIISQKDFLATLEARLLELAAHIITTEEFMDGIHEEYEYCMVNKNDILKIENVLNIIHDPLFANPTALAPSPSDMLTRLNQTLISPTTLGATKRDVSPISSNDIAPKSTSSIDPYRELPEK